MELTLFIELIILGLVIIFTVIFLYKVMKYDKGTDYEKWCVIYNEQKEETLLKIKNGNKKINNIETEIRKYKKKLKFPLVNKK